MNEKVLAVGAILALLPVACEYDRYEIEMIPRGRVLQRRISGWHAIDDEKKKLNETDLAALEKAYPQRLSDPGEPVQTFVGTFRTRTPQDIGGAGYYLYYETPMGSAGIYSERLRGNDNLFAAVEQMQTAADKLTDLTIGWFESEMGEDERFGKLSKFLDEQFRVDLKNFALHMWIKGIARLEDGEVLVRIAQYLTERDYFDPERIPEILQAMDLAEDDEDEKQTRRAAMVIIQRLVATRMGVPEDEPIPESLGFLSDLSKARASLARHVRTTKEYRQFVAERQRQAAAAAPTTHITETTPASQPSELSLVDEYLGKLIQIELALFGSSLDSVDASLALHTRPVATNGEWNEDIEKVVWSGKLHQSESPPAHLPTLFYAIWAVPDKDFQKRHFGGEVLNGKHLVEYCLWYQALDKHHARRWDALLEHLHPDDCIEKLSSFRFKGEAPLPTTQPAGNILTGIEAMKQPATRPAEHD